MLAPLRSLRFIAAILQPYRFLPLTAIFGTSALAEGPAPAAPSQAAATEKKIDFETQILPIFKRNCLACHNQTDAESDLVLETPKAIMKGSEDGAVIVAHDGLKSPLYKSAARQTKPLMPPKNNKVGAEPLKPDELALLKTWIDQGATGTVSAKTKPVQWQPLPPGLHPILAVAATPDGQYAACGRANQIFLYHVPTGQVIERLIDPHLSEKPNRSGYVTSAQRDYVQSLAFSPDGRTLASGEYRMVKIWKRDSNLPQFTLGSEPAQAIAVSPNGQWLASAAKDNVIHVWEAASGKPVKDLPGHTAAVTSLRFSPDSAKLVSGSADKTLRVWDIAAGNLFAQAEAPQPITSVAWAMGGKEIASAGGDNVIRFWQVPTAANAPLTPMKEGTGHTQPVTCLEASPDGKQLLSGSLDGSVRQWNVEPPKQLRQMNHGAPVVAVAYAPNGKILASAGGTVAHLWSADRGQSLADIKGDHVRQAKLVLRTQASAFQKSEIAYWKTTLEAATKAQPGKDDAAKKAAATVQKATQALTEKQAAMDKANDKDKATATSIWRDAKFAKVSAEKALALAQTAAQEAAQAVTDAKAGGERAAAEQKQADQDIEALKKEVAKSEQPIRAVAFTPDSLTLATAGDDQMIHTWSAANGAGFDNFPSQLGPVQALAYTADARLFSAAKENGAVVWHPAPSWSLVRAIGTGDLKSPIVNRVLTMDFSHDGQYLVTGGGSPTRNGELKIWKVSDGSLVREIKPSHSDTIYGVAISPDGKTIATASADKFVKLFDFNTGKLIKALAGHTHYVLGVAWKANGRMIASCGADKVLKLWTFPAGEQFKSMENKYKGEITAVRYLGTSDQILTASGDARVRLVGEDEKLKDLSVDRDKGFIFSIAASADGSVVLGGGQDSVLHAWEVATAKKIFSADPPAPELPVKDVSQSAKH